MILPAPIDETQCGTDCPECGGNGSIGGDTESMWSCTRWTHRVYRNIERERKIMRAEADA